MSRVEASRRREPNWSKGLFWLVAVVTTLILVVLVTVYLASQTLVAEP